MSKRQSPFNSNANSNNRANNAGEAKAAPTPAKKHRRIVNDNPTTIKDAGTIVTEYSTTNKLAKQLNTILKSAFEDCYGTRITLDGAAGLKVTVAFKPLAAPAGEKDTRAFIPVSEQVARSGGNKLEMAIVQRNQAMMKSNNFELSAYGAELLYDLILPRIKAKLDPFNPKTYKNIISEASFGQTMFNMNGTIYCSLDCIDINAAVKLIRGEKDLEDGSAVVYGVTPMRPMSLMMGGTNQDDKNWVISINGMSKVAFEKTMNELGGITDNGDFVVTGTI